MTETPAAPRRSLDLTAGLLLLYALLTGYVLFADSPATPRALPAPLPNPLRAYLDEVKTPLLDSLGLASYALFGLGLVIAGLAIFRASTLPFLLRSLGWLALLVPAAFLIHLTADNAGLKDAGGSIGAWLVQETRSNFGPAGSWILWTLSVFGSLTLAWPELLRWLGRMTQHLLDGVAWSLVALSQGISPRMREKLRPLRPVVVETAKKKKPGSAPELNILPLRPRQDVPINPTRQPKERKESIKQPAAEIVPFAPPMPVQAANTIEYELPSLQLLDDPVKVQTDSPEQLQATARLLEQTFAEFGVTVQVVGIHTGPVITQFEMSLDTGIRLSKVTALSDDLALKLKVQSVRVVPMVGKSTVGVEVPNENRCIVRIKELIAASEGKMAKAKLPLFLGKDNEGNSLVYDLAEMPHLLIAGRTGTGKSVCLNTIILSLLLTRTPEEAKLVMIDPKKVELAEYGRLPHLMHPVVTDSKKSETILAWAVDKMEERYEILRRARVRNIAGYNELSYSEIWSRVRPIDEEEKAKTPPFMPYIVIVVDEVGDLLMEMKKEVEGHIIRLAQKSRAAGIHLILTTQKPTVDVITGLIKSNLPARICFQVASRSDSRVVLDEMGAEKLLGKGDMLFLQPNTSSIVRAQGAYASDAEIGRIVAELEVENPVYDAELMNLKSKEDEGKAKDRDAEPVNGGKNKDKLFEAAVEVVVREGRGSCSLLQRALGIGYGRAARLIDYMAEDGIVGEYNGAQARDVIITHDQWEAMKGGPAETLAESA